MNSERIAKLSPEKRQLLERLLRERTGDASATHGKKEVLRPRPREERLILSHAQRRMWFLTQRDPTSPAYNVPFAMRLRGALDVNALRSALDEIIQRHAVLRTTFINEQGEPRLILTSAHLEQWEEVHLDRLSPIQAAEDAARLAEQAGLQPLDLSRPPLLRVILFRLASDDHVLWLASHHIAFDGWSIDVLLRELALAYPALTAGLQPQLSPLTIQYSDYAYWEQSTVEGDTLSKLHAYWQSRLAGAPPELTFTGSRRGSSTAARGTGSLTVEISDSLYDDMQTFCHERHFTLFIVLLASLKATLQRFCTTDDIVIGTQSANRGRRELEELIGVFVNPLTLRTDLSGRPDFVELCRRVRETVTGAFAHQELPFDQVVRALQPRTEGVRHPLFNVVFQLRRQTMEQRRLGDLTVEALPDGGAKPFAPKFDLVFSFVDTGRSVGGAIEYDPAIFSEAMIATLNETHQHLFRQALDHSDVPLVDLSLVSPRCKQLVIEEWNRTVVPYPNQTCLHHLFEQTADRYPDGRAVSFSGQTLTYAELDRRANRLAHYLLTHSRLGPERIALIYLDRSFELVVACLAVLKTGGAFLPMDPRHASQRIDSIVLSAQPAVIITSTRFLSALPSSDIPVICCDRDAAAITYVPDTRPAVRVFPDNLAYLIYTSGSTGTPKGVMGHHRGLCNLSEAQVRTFAISPQDCILQFASLTFDAFVWELVMAWRTGATLQLARWDELLPGPELIALLQRERVTILTIPPSVLTVLPTADLPDLHTLIVAGEACPADLVARWAPGRQMYNAYGPTETTIWATHDTCIVGATPPIGRPIANLHAYVLDDNLEPVPPGVVGELYIGGVGLARGYLGRPDLTAIRFIPDPFTAVPGSRLYRTGDLGRYLSDGRIHFEGRTDDQVKIRGFRIEPGEIQAVITNHPQVRQAHVMAVPRPSQGLQLVAWYAVEPTAAELPVKELRAWVEQRLPHYMRPAAYVGVEQLPLTSHGKVDRLRLPAPDEGSADYRATPSGAPHGAVEQTLARIWCDVLRVENIGRDDNFFELGGDSILGIQVISRANTAGIGLQAAQIFDHATIAKLASVARVTARAAAELIDARPPNGTASLSVLTPPSLSEHVSLVNSSRLLHDGHAEQKHSFASAPATMWRSYELSSLQEGLLYHCLRAPNSSLYVQQFNMILQGRLDGVALQRAWQTVMDRHDSLRTAFVWEQIDSPLQQVYRNLTIPFLSEDWRALPSEERECRWRQFQHEDLQRGFVLDRPPLLRCALFQLDEETHAFTWTVHHLVLDGWSLSLLTKEVFTLYRAYSSGGEAKLSTPAPFADYIAWLKSRDHTVANAYWRRTLAGVVDPVLLAQRLPTASAPSAETTAVAQETLALTTESSAALQAFCRHHRLTLNTVFQTSWAMVLSRYLGQSDVLYGLTVSGRPAELHGVESMVGLFVNTLPFRTQVPHAVTVSAWLAEVQRQLLELRQYEFSSLVEVQRQSAAPAGEPLFDTLVAFQTYPVADGQTLDRRQLLIQEEPQLERTGYPLTIMAEPGAPFHIRFIYDRNLLAPEIVRRLAVHLRTAMTTVPMVADCPVAEWSMLESVEKDCILHEWNGTDCDYPQARLIHHWIADQAQRRPETTAVIFEGAALTYAELNAQANQLAHWLHSQGIGPESVVGLYAERSIELIVALLAILKAGGAYTPFAVEHPRARLQNILKQACPRLILTQRHLRDRLPATEIATFILDDDSPPWQDHAGAEPNIDVHLDNLAYIIHTSGSTGEPKGVMNTHAGILNRILWCQEKYPLSPQDRFLQKTPYTFDVSVWEFFWPLMTGACLVVARPDGHRDNVYLAETCRREGVTVMHFVPSMLQVFLEDPDLARRAEALRLVICSGEALTPSLCQRFFATLPADLLNLYGPTEAAVEVSHWLCQREDSQPLVPIGRPIANVQLYILDATGNLCPAGVPGELHIGGVALARGYQGRPDLTAERFTPDPFSHIPGRRLYRTGDLTRYRSDGTIEYLGRIDWQIKLRGQRIELSEIEEHVRSYPGVRNTVVTYREDRPGDGHVAAYVVGPDLDESSLRTFLAERLPDYMTPSFFVFLDSLPLTVSGKIDRKALPAPSRTGGGASRRFVAPRDALEIELAQLWADLLQVETVGVRDHFFLDLGGHSLLALRLLSRTQKSWPCVYTLSEFLREPTVESLARLVRGNGYTGRDEETPLVTIQPRGSRPTLFLTPPALGVVLCYYELARTLGVDQPVQAFQAPAVEGRGEPINDIPMLARWYIKAMRRVQPRGPFYLGGYSFGGVVAFEMARQLLTEGEGIAALIIFDTLAPRGSFAGTVTVDEARLLAEIAGVLERYHGVAPSITPEDLGSFEQQERFAEVRRRLAARDILYGASDVLCLEGLLAANRAAIEGLARYQPNIYPSRLDLIRCLEPSANDTVGVASEVLADPSMGWQRWCASPVEVRRTPGDHISLLKPPGVTEVAQIVTAILGRPRLR